LGFLCIHKRRRVASICFAIERLDLPNVFCRDVFLSEVCVMKWIEERDALIARTKAFVQSVAGGRPEIAPAPPVLNRVEPARTENPVFTALPAPAEPSTLFEPVVERLLARPLEALPARVLPQSEARKEIQNRVAAFQAHQHRFHREREAYFKSVLIKVRSAIENGPDTPSA
jgi:hypothetical protein